MAATASALIDSVDDLARHEVVRLLLAAAGSGQAWLVGDPEVNPGVERRFRANLARRRRGEPLQYIEGSTQFGPIDLAVDGRVLIPRPETEMLFELALQRLADIAAPVVVDLCTGSGSLALAIKNARPDARVLGTDVSEDALLVADHNRSALALEVELIEGDLFAALPFDLAGSVDLIVSNPPYVSEREYADLPAEIVDYEPRVALVAGDDGLDVLRRIASDAIQWLTAGGGIICEMGESQGEACRQLFAVYDPEIARDLTGRDRFVLGYAPMPGNVH